MIILSSLTHSFGSRVLFDRVDFQFPHRERIALVGPNGAGKSTLLDIIVGRREPSDGEVRKPKDLRIGYLPQIPNPNPKASIIEECMSGATELVDLQARMDECLAKMNDSVEAADAYTEIERRFANHGGYEWQGRADKIIQGLGFRHPDQDPLQLSGGWRMRLELAKIFLRRPDFLLLDEPTNHLDLPALAWVERYLQSYQGTMVFVSHDRPLLNRLATSVLELRHGRLRSFVGNFDAYLEQRHLREEEVQAKLEGLRREQKHHQDFIDRFGAKASKATQAQSRAKMLAKLQALEEDLESQVDQADQTIHIRLPEIEASSRVPLIVKDLSIGYASTVLCKSIHFQLERGARIAVIGSNGIGKSTLLKTLVGEIPKLRGDFLWDQKTTRAYFAQDQLFDDLPPMSILQLMQREGCGEPEARRMLGAMLFRGEDVHKSIHVLSGGERHRVGLAKLFYARSNLLLLDEPTNHLDMSSVSLLISTLQQYKGSLIMVSHDRDFIDELATHILVLLPDGRSEIFEGNLESYQRLAKISGFPDILDPEPEESPKPVVAKSKPKPKSSNGESLLKKIKVLEDEHALIQKALSETAPTDAAALHQLLEQEAAIIAKKEQLEDTWLQNQIET